MVLNMLTDSILKPLDDGLIAQLLLLDLSSAFVTISHEIIFTRLNDVGITNNDFDLLKDILQKNLFSINWKWNFPMCLLNSWGHSR